jgi:hypothetical protein
LRLKKANQAHLKWVFTEKSVFDEHKAVFTWLTSPEKVLMKTGLYQFDDIIKQDSIHTK